MEKIIVSIRDNLVEKFNTPIMVDTSKEAIHSYLYTIRNEPYLKTNADQYSLWQLGIFDDKTGNITPDSLCLVNEAATAIAVKEGDGAILTEGEKHEKE